ncbi:MAG: hypothetical protein PHF29_07170 [Candidatus Riflebacteria bacterium]|nr:hypothetical protein [Candidatus Riflebacteria bacterium]
MKRLEFSEKKQLALKFIAKIAEGYRLTGPNNAFNEAMKGIESVGIQQASLYQFIRADEELSRAYFQARDSQRKNVLSGSKHLGVEQRVKLIELIIENIKNGMNVRGDKYHENAVVAACKSLGLPIIHWATIHRWLRMDYKDLKQKFHNAVKLSSDARADYSIKSAELEREYKEIVKNARIICREAIQSAKKNRDKTINDAKNNKIACRKKMKNKLRALTGCGKIATGGNNEN